MEPAAPTDEALGSPRRSNELVDSTRKSPRKTATADGEERRGSRVRVKVPATVPGSESAGEAAVVSDAMAVSPRLSPRRDERRGSRHRHRSSTSTSSGSGSVATTRSSADGPGADVAEISPASSPRSSSPALRPDKLEALVATERRASRRKSSAVLLPGVANGGAVSSPPAAAPVDVSGGDDVLVFEGSDVSIDDVQVRPRIKKKKKVRIKIKRKTDGPAPAAAPAERELWAALMIQRNYRRRVFSLAVEKLLLYTRRRQDLLNEILATERTYVTCLQRLKRDFVHPMSSKISDTELHNIFPKVNEIWKLHEHLLSKLSVLMAAPRRDFDAICELFSDVARNAVEQYSAFLMSADQAALVLKRLLETDRALAELVEGVVSPSGFLRGLRYLNELMVTPMQRLPRYELLFKELLKCSENHDDFPALQAAHADIKRTTTLINDRKRESDERYRRSYIEQHASMEVLREHELKEKEISSIKYCAHCAKAIWGLSQKCFKCSACGQLFHPACRAAVGAARACAQRRRVDLTSKKLVFQQEVLLLPADEAAAKQNRAGGRLRAPGTAGSPGGPAGSRSPAPARLLSSPAMPRAIAGSPSLQRIASVREPKTELKGLLLVFEDGIGIGYKWVIDGDNDNPIIDVIGELPWSAAEFVVLEPRDGVCPFSVTSKSVGWTFFLRSALDVESLARLVRQVQSDRLAARATMRKQSSSADIRMDLLMRSGRYKQNSTGGAARDGK